MAVVRSKARKPHEEIKVELPDAPGIYLLTCTVTGDTYVGQAKNLRSRHRSHSSNIRDRFRQSLRIGRILDLGCTCEHFTFRVLEMCRAGKLCDREKHWICKLRPTLNSNSPRGFSRVCQWE